MNRASIYKLLGYDGHLLTIDDACVRYPDYYDLNKIPVDKVYFAKSYPTVLFMEVERFDKETLARVSKTLHSAWNYRVIPLLMVVSDAEIRVYNCYACPFDLQSTKQDTDSPEYAEIYTRQVSSHEITAHLSELIGLFSIYNINNGTVWHRQDLLKRRLSENTRVDAYLIGCLTKATGILERQGLDRDVIHALLIRSLFVLFLEDKGAAKEAGLYGAIKNGCESFFDILDDKNATYRLFELVNARFNGNITPLAEKELESVHAGHLQVVKRCFYDGNVDDVPLLFHERLFRFDIIRIEVLSEIYEHFLGHMKKTLGQYYTPASLVRLIMNDNLPIVGATSLSKVLDPACGSGIFLVEAFKRLVQIQKRRSGKERLDFSELCDILSNHIYGIEIDPMAIKVAAFSLYLALIDELDPKTLWTNENHRLPYLVRKPGEPINDCGGNLLCCNTISEVNPQDLPPMDLVAGNPPFGTDNLSPEIKSYCQRYGFAAEQVLPFLHKAVAFAPHGKVAMIFTSKVLTNNNGRYQKFRDWMFSDAYVERIYNLSIFRNATSSFGGSLFADGIAPVVIAYYRGEVPENPSKTIAYWAPRTFVKSDVSDNVIIDKADIKYIPRHLCAGNKNKIWKAAMWGDYAAVRLVERLRKKCSLKGWLEHNAWIYGRGVNRDSKRPDFIPSLIIDIKKVDRYYAASEYCTRPNDLYFRKINDELVRSPYVLFNQGLHKNNVLCTLFEGEGYFTTCAFAFNGKGLEEKKFLVAYLNSSLAKFILFLTASSWAIERDTIMLEEVLEIPSPFIAGSERLRREVIETFDELVALKESCIMADTSFLEQKLDEYFYRIFEISPMERVYVEDTLKYSLGLFMGKEKSISLMRINRSDADAYADLLKGRLEGFLVHSALNVAVDFYMSGDYDPLMLMVVSFGETSGVYGHEISHDMRTQLASLDGLLLTEMSDSILLQRDVKLYDKNRVYLLKANRKLYWTKSRALDDAGAIISDMLNMTD